MTSIPLKGGIALAIASFSLFFGLAANAAPTGKIDICHKPGEPNQKILNINPGSVANHQGHGDYVVDVEQCDAIADNNCDGTLGTQAENDESCPDDGVACTVSTCVGPDCVNEPNDALCDDANPNTTDSCDANLGCVNEPISGCAAAGGASVAGLEGCYFLGDLGQSCTQVCDAQALAYSSLTLTETGSDGTNPACTAALQALGAPVPQMCDGVLNPEEATTAGGAGPGSGVGCTYFDFHVFNNNCDANPEVRTRIGWQRVSIPPTLPDDNPFFYGGRVCACE